MRPDELYVLPADVLVFPVGELPAAARALAELDSTQFTVTRIGSRERSRLVSAEAAELLGEFVRPTSLVDAVIRFGDRRTADHRAVLTQARGVLRTFMAAGMLVPADSFAAATIEPILSPGQRIGDFTLVQCVHVLEDVELHRATGEDGTPVAVKVARSTDEAQLRHARTKLARECAILGSLSGPHFPRVVTDGVECDRPFLAMEWIDARHAEEYAETHRRSWSPSVAAQLFDAAVAVVDAYADLHDHGVVHGDVHPKNALLSAAAHPYLIDFALARAPAEPGLDTAQRGGVTAFYEPECAAAMLAGATQPPATFRSDQYGVAVLVYLMLTGRHPVNRLQTTQQVLRQIVDRPAPAFLVHGIRSWPAVERVLARAMSKSPDERYPSVGVLADELRAAASSRIRTAARQGSAARRGPATRSFLRQTVTRLGRGSDPLVHGLDSEPAVSVNYGAAGIAYFFYRMGLTTQRFDLLSTALQWIALAHQRGNEPGAFYSRERRITPDTVGATSIYHSMSGVHCVEALVLNAIGDLVGARRAATAFASVARRRTEVLDLTVGRSSALIGAALLCEAFAGTGAAGRAGLVDFGDETMADIWRQLAGQTCHDGEIRYLGVAHGWAGVAYAALRWCQATGAVPPSTLQPRLDELRLAARRDEHGLSWPASLESAGDPTGWCHGPAGYTHLWTLAAKIYKDEAYAELALGAAEHAWHAQHTIGTLCCGLAGQAYAQLDAYRHTGDRVWVRRAEQLAGKALALAGTRHHIPNSLYKGDVGVALLVADLDQPAGAAMPLFGPEGWPSSTPP
jgi:serine/threonine-protein kinase